MKKFLKIKLYILVLTLVVSFNYNETLNAAGDVADINEVHINLSGGDQA